MSFSAELMPYFGPFGDQDAGILARDMEFSTDGSLLAVKDVDETIRIINPKNGATISISLKPQAQMAALHLIQYISIQVWNYS
ncbi:hypothetical protein O0881_04540 [Janthinobacterium sp. SUN100]|uniref:hypothetical protein n=1 Tax=Janthinobacterium sp. SUN100 TaxID=3004101 RepID=UPI0025B1506C|nr:hypothetical protein [Janthinobacterium sp. SUN100]MDN2701264.1 hypothetical protein [Janthinobacterium sp. SUN100]